MIVPTGNNIPGISVIICCYNSALHLPQTLKYLSLQKIPSDLNWEIIVVDNNSKDNTGEIAQRLAKKYNVSNRMRVVSELKAGLANARRRGANEAMYEYLIFCDDDNWLCDFYMNRVFEIFNSDTKIGAIGGSGIAKFEIDQPPKWFEEYKESYACGKQGEKSGYVTKPRNYLFGAGLSVRKTLLMRLYQEKKFILSDRKGNAITSGGDGEITMNICLLGYELYFDDELYFFHFIPRERLTFKYLKKLHYSFGKAHYWVYPMQLKIAGQNVDKYPRKILWQRIKTNLKNIRTYLFTDNETPNAINGAWAFGILVEALKDKVGLSLHAKKTRY